MVNFVLVFNLINSKKRNCTTPTRGVASKICSTSLQLKMRLFLTRLTLFSNVNYESFNVIVKLGRICGRGSFTRLFEVKLLPRFWIIYERNERKFSTFEEKFEEVWQGENRQGNEAIYDLVIKKIKVKIVILITLKKRFN